MENHLIPVTKLTNCMCDVIAILLIGETLRPEKIREIKEATLRSIEAIGPGVGIFMDWLPFLRFLGNATYKTIISEITIRVSTVRAWMKQKPTNGFISVIQAMSDEEKNNQFP